LLYYEEAGLLLPAGRSAAGYRRYGEAQCERLRRIRDYRAAGLTLAQVGALLAGSSGPAAIAERLEQIQLEMAGLREQQAVLVRLLTSSQLAHATFDKAGWTAMLAAAGLDEAAMARWHGLFEQQSPAAHAAFLRTLGIGEDEAARIRRRSRGVNP
jgi:DNA-binding transcriptional MerR regulator